MATMPLKEVDSVEILTILDNTIDMLLPDAGKAKRSPRTPDALIRESLIAEHGFSAQVKVTNGNTSEILLFDAGLSRKGLIHNLDVLEIKPDEPGAYRSSSLYRLESRARDRSRIASRLCAE
jgi:7,8-dihydropterin-6-yl-methyl-4-(beta-D-ribofuranosyl)aminobenzene 5'-phosphate synthase